jgi:restriction system protein
MVVQEVQMAIPGYQEFMLPLLTLAGDGKEHSVTEAMTWLAERFNLSDAEQSIMLPSGAQTRFYNRVTWATTYLAKSLLLTKSGRGRFRIAPRGLEVLEKKPQRIDSKFLEQFPEYIAFRDKKNTKPRRPEGAAVAEATIAEAESTPAERLDEAYEELRKSLADDLLQRVRLASPKGFERMVVRLLVAMGYGGGRLDYAEVTGKSGDEGIDGVIREDRLGLDMVYVQAKKWENTVGPGEIDKFVGSLMRKKARKGVFITSGSFTDGAGRAAKEATVTIRLIDGDELAELMIDFNVGVANEETYIVKKIDSDFFDDLAM